MLLKLQVNTSPDGELLTCIIVHYMYGRLLEAGLEGIECMSDKKISTTVYITKEQSDRLKQLHSRTKVPVAEYIRQGIDLVLKENADKLPGQLSLVD